MYKYDKFITFLSPGPKTTKSSWHGMPCSTLASNHSSGKPWELSMNDRGVSAPGGVCSGGVSALGGLPLGGCLLWGVSAPGGLLLGGCLLPRGVSAPRGVCSQGGLLLGGVCSGGCLLQGGCIPACTEADTLPPEDRILDTRLWKFITLAQLRCSR